MACEDEVSRARIGQAGGCKGAPQEIIRPIDGNRPITLLKDSPFVYQEGTAMSAQEVLHGVRPKGIVVIPHDRVDRSYGSQPIHDGPGQG